MESAESLESELIKELQALRKDPTGYSNWIRSNRQNLYKGNELELLKDDLKTKVLLKTVDGRKACMAAITACDKAKGLTAFDFRKGLDRISAATAEDIAGKNATQTTLKLSDLLQQHAKVKSTPKQEFKGDRIIIFGPDLYTAKNIVSSLLINDGVPDAKARNALLDNTYKYCGVSVRKHPSQDYVAVLTLCTAVYEDL